MVHSIGLLETERKQAEYFVSIHQKRANELIRGMEDGTVSSHAGKRQLYEANKLINYYNEIMADYQKAIDILCKIKLEEN